MVERHIRRLTQQLDQGTGLTSSMQLFGALSPAQPTHYTTAKTHVLIKREEGHPRGSPEVIGLGFGVSPDEPGLMLEKVAELVKNDKWKEGSGKKREKMLGEKMALTPYLLKYLETYGAA